MTDNVAKQIDEWAENFNLVSLTPSIIDKLGSLGDLARTLERKINVFTFTYKSDGMKVAGFLVLPKIYTNKLPVIIYNRGGTEDYGIVTQGMLFTHLATIANYGYIVIGTQYPGNSLSEGIDERGGKTDINSILNLKELIDTLDATNNNKIGMYGFSRGGMMTYLCLSKVSWVTAALTMGGQTSLDRTLKNRPEMAAIFDKHFGNSEEYRFNRSVVNWVDKLNKKTPICLLHGSADSKVNVSESFELAEKLNHIKHPYELHILLNGNHSLNNLQTERDLIIRNWFDFHLKSHEINAV